MIRRPMRTLLAPLIGTIVLALLGYWTVFHSEADVPKGPLVCTTDSASAASALFANEAQDAAITTLAGEPVMLRALAGKHATVVLFCAYSCPCSDGYGERLLNLRSAYEPRGISFVAVHSNRDETTAGMKSYLARKNFPLTVYRDNDCIVADMMKAAVTPEVFVFTPDWRLQYHGRIDDDKSGLFVTDRSLQWALDTLLSGKTLVVKEKTSLGCAIVRTSSQ